MLKAWLDLIFPPLCLFCKERCRTRYLCPECWSLCEPPDPIERCRHCFAELTQKGTVCLPCRRAPSLSAMRGYVFDPVSPARTLGFSCREALAGFALYQWIQLDWPTPEGVIPLPDPHSMAIGKIFAAMLDLPFIRALTSSYTYREELLEEERDWLLFDADHCLEDLQKATWALREAFPKRVYLLSLYPRL